MRRPGRWLRAVGASLCTKQTIDRVIDPIIADLQAEYVEARRAARWWHATWVGISGYWAFWKAIGLHTIQSGPRSLWTTVAAERWTLAQITKCSVATFIAVTAVLSLPPIVDGYSHQLGVKLTMLLVPQAIPLSIAISLPLGIVCGLCTSWVTAARITSVLLLAIAAALFAFVATLMVPASNEAFLGGLAEQLDRAGVTYSLPRGTPEMTLSELAIRIDESDAAGLTQNGRRFLRAYHIRFALPAATAVMSLLAIAICGSLGTRSRRIVAMVIGFVLYWMILATGERSTNLPAIVSVWTANLVFTVISVGLLKMLPSRVQGTETIH